MTTTSQPVTHSITPDATIAAQHPGIYDYHQHFYGDMSGEGLAEHMEFLADTYKINQHVLATEMGITAAALSKVRSLKNFHSVNSETLISNQQCLRNLFWFYDINIVFGYCEHLLSSGQITTLKMTIEEMQTRAYSLDVSTDDFMRFLSLKSRSLDTHRRICIALARQHPYILPLFQFNHHSLYNDKGKMVVFGDTDQWDGKMFSHYFQVRFPTVFKISPFTFHTAGVQTSQ